MIPHKPAGPSKPQLFTRILAACILTAPQALSNFASAQSWTPTAAGTYSWNSAANWNPPTVPNRASASVTLGSGIVGNQTITVNSPTTINQLTIGDSGNLGFSYDIGAGVAGNNNFGGFVFGGTAPSLTMTATTTADQTITAMVNGNLTISDQRRHADTSPSRF